MLDTDPHKFYFMFYCFLVSQLSRKLQIMPIALKLKKPRAITTISGFAAPRMLYDGRYFEYLAQRLILDRSYFKKHLFLIAVISHSTNLHKTAIKKWKLQNWTQTQTNAASRGQSFTHKQVPTYLMKRKRLPTVGTYLM